MRYRGQYEAVLEKRHWLESHGRVSEPDEVGSRAAILVPFIAELVQDARDSRENFERQTEALARYYAARGRKPEAVWGATRDDFARVLADMTVPTVVVTGFGSFSAVAAPLTKSENPQYAYYDWWHLAHMATHLKLGKAVMLQCCGYNKVFNPPLVSGVVSRYADIRGPAGQARYADDIQGAIGVLDAPIEDLALKELSYDQVRERFRVDRHREVPAIVPDEAYVAGRGIYNLLINPDMPAFPNRVGVPYPTREQFRAYQTM